MLDYKYKNVIPLPNETFVVTTNNDKVGIIDLDGNEIIPLSENNQDYNFNYYLDLMLIGNCIYNYKTGEMLTNDAFLEGDLKKDVFQNGNSLTLGSGSYYVNGLYYMFSSSNTLRIYKINADGYEASDYIKMLDIPGNYEEYIEYGVFPQIIKGENGEKDKIVFSHLVIE